MNSRTPMYSLPFSCLSILWKNRELTYRMIKRELAERYKGSIMGLAWPFLNSALMLVVYTFLFSVIFKARWGVSEEEGKIQFAVVLFVGMIVHGLFSEVLNRAPSLILANANYVKKIVFPLEILPVVSMGVALFNSLINIFVMLAAFTLFNGFFHWTALFIPIVLLPFVILTLGIAWFLASLGVFLRDISQAVGIFTLVAGFLSPVFYPISAVPEAFQPLMMANPLTFIIEQARAVLIWGHTPDWTGLASYSLMGIGVAWLGFSWFQKTRMGFADVI